ncbi:MAG: DNA repair exonuclease [Clostridiales bacterium]|nr:DNA repair exonuclease [Clostridiales bacterium]
MKFIHIADVHLGATPDWTMPWAGDREKEIWESFKNIINICNEEDVDLLLIAGDFFHKQPLVGQLKEADYYFSKLKATHVVLMAGNHDYIGSRSNYIRYEWNKNVHMLMGEEVEPLILEDINTSVYGFSYHSRDILKPMYDDIEPLNSQGIHILLAHGGDEKNVPINLRKLGSSRFDYIALGHIHKPEILSNNMAYSGSLEPLDKNEVGERGYIIGEINKDREISSSISFVPSSIREYKRLIITIDQDTTQGALEDIIKVNIKEQGEKNIYRIAIEGYRDEKIHFDRESLLSLGNIIEVIDNSHPDYDFDGLYKENRDNMIGMFIKSIRESDQQDEISKKALYYGIEALLGSRE